MKAIITSAVITCAFITLTLCLRPDNPDTFGIILIDQTEPHKALPTAGEVLPLFSLDSYKWGSARIGFRAITDVSLNRTTEFYLPKGGPILLANSFERDRQVAAYNEDVAAHLDSLAHDTIGRPHSSVFLSLAHALNTMAASNANHRFIVVYSDLFENRSTLSFYDPHTLALLQSDPEKIEARLLADAPLAEDLTGITIYFVYEPKDEQADTNFRLISNFYSVMFTSRGARVIIGANLIVQ